MAHPNAGLTGAGVLVTMASVPTHRTTPMNTPPPSPANRPEPSQRSHADEAQVRAWLKLKVEVAELHARLEYLKLLLKLGVGQSKGQTPPAAPRG